MWSVPKLDPCRRSAWRLDPCCQVGSSRSAWRLDPRGRLDSRGTGDWTLVVGWILAVGLAVGPSWSIGFSWHFGDWTLVVGWILLVVIWILAVDLALGRPSSILEAWSTWPLYPVDSLSPPHGYMCILNNVRHVRRRPSRRYEWRHSARMTNRICMSLRLFVTFNTGLGESRAGTAQEPRRSRVDVDC